MENSLPSTLLVATELARLGTALYGLLALSRHSCSKTFPATSIPIKMGRITLSPRLTGRANFTLSFTSVDMRWGRCIGALSAKIRNGFLREKSVAFFKTRREPFCYVHPLAGVYSFGFPFERTSFAP